MDGLRNTFRSPRDSTDALEFMDSSMASSSLDKRLAEMDSSQEAGIASPPCPFLGHKNYVPVEERAWPTIGQTWVARRVQEGDLVLIKLVERGPALSSFVRSELLLHARCVGHPHILQLVDIFLTDIHLALVLEYSSGGDLSQLISRRGLLPEPEARAFFQQMLSATLFLHSLGASKRDARLECKLLQPGQDGQLVVKVQDFAYSRTEQINSDPNSALGSLPYTAPEVLNNVVTAGEPVDVWGLGVALYRMALGRFPFESTAVIGSAPSFGSARSGSGQQPRDAVQRVLARIAAADYEPPAGVSSELQDLLGRMLERLPGQRATLAEVAVHPWLTLGEHAPALQTPMPPQTPKWSEAELLGIINEASHRVRSAHEDLEALADEVLDEEEMDDLLDELELDEAGQPLHMVYMEQERR